jgi:hypothetical protein
MPAVEVPAKRCIAFHLRAGSQETLNKSAGVSWLSGF